MPIALVAVEIDDDVVPTERTAIIMRALWIASRRGKKLTTAAVARLAHMRWKGAYRLLLKIERVTPELRCDLDGWWLDDVCIGPRRTY